MQRLLRRVHTRLRARRLRPERIDLRIDVDGLMRASTCPTWTTAPSSTSICAIFPPTFDFTSTLCSGEIVPVSTTLISTSPRCTVSLCSAFGCALNRNFAPIITSAIKMTSGSPHPRSSFFPISLFSLLRAKHVFSQKALLLPLARSEASRASSASRRKRRHVGCASLAESVGEGAGG